MNIPPLCIIQARMGSTRLPGKMLLKLGDETLIARACRIAGEAFGPANVVVAIPASDHRGPLGEELRKIQANVFAWDGDEADVLGRFHACAHRFRWHPDSVIVRYTPDDWGKNLSGLKCVASGVRMPVETCGEAFTLGMLDAAHERYPLKSGELPLRQRMREHITYALFDTEPPKAPEHPLGLPWSIDTAEQYEAVKTYLEKDAPALSAWDKVHA